LFILGAGAVGSTFAYALAQSGVADEIVLMDMDSNLVQGQVMDLAHGCPFTPTSDHRRQRPGLYRCACHRHHRRSKQRPGESRLALLQRNARIIESVMDEIASQGSQAVVVLVSNPVDILTYVAQQRVKCRAAGLSAPARCWIAPGFATCSASIAA